MKLLKIFTPFCILFFAFTSVTYSQSTKYNTWSATVSGGSMLFYGDLRQFDFFPMSKHYVKKHYHSIKQNFSERKWGGGLSVTKHFSPAFALQAQFQTGTLEGIKTRQNEYFITVFNEYGVNGIINFGNLFFPYIPNHKINVYGLLGYSWIDFKVKRWNISTDALIHSQGYNAPGQEHKRTTEVCIPIGLGFKYKINKHFDIGLECQLVNVNSDKLDDHVRSLSARDKYGYTSFQFTYKIGRNENSLEWTTLREMESSKNTPLFIANDKKIDSLKNKLNGIDDKVADLTKKLNDHINQPQLANNVHNDDQNNKVNGNNVPSNNSTGVTVPNTANTSGNNMKTDDLAPQFAAMNKKIDSLNENLKKQLPTPQAKDLSVLFASVNKRIDSLSNKNHMNPVTKTDDLAPIFASINKSIDSLNNKINDHSKPAPQARDLSPFFASINKRIDSLSSKVNSSVNPTLVETNNDHNVIQNSVNHGDNTQINIQGTTVPGSTTITTIMKPQFSIFFAVNLTYIDPLNEEKVAEAAKMLNEDPTLIFDIVGYADKTGNTAYNDVLSLRRAQAVKNDLIKSYGISEKRLNVIGKGDKYPLSPDIYSVNRRVDFIIKKTK